METPARTESTPPTAASAGASSPPASPRPGWFSRMFKESPQKSPDSKRMAPLDVWKKGTGVTNMGTGQRYDKPEEGSPPKTVSEILAPLYVADHGPPSYESKASFEKKQIWPR